MLKINIIALYQTLRVLRTEYYIAHNFFLEPAQWTRLAADVSELYVEVRAQTPADVGKGKMNRGSIDKICVAHLIIPRVCRE